MTVKKIKLTLKEASEWVADGYEIECYALVHPVTRTEKRRIVTKPLNEFMTDETRLRFSLEGNPPSYGSSFKVWTFLKEHPYKDPRQTYTRAELINLIQDNLELDRAKAVARISALVHHHECLLVVADKTEK